MIDVRGTESTIETTILPGVLDVQTWVPTLMANPAATVGIDMRGVRMTGLIVEIALFALYGSRRFASGRCFSPPCAAGAAWAAGSGPCGGI